MLRILNLSFGFYCKLCENICKIKSWATQRKFFGCILTATLILCHFYAVKLTVLIAKHTVSFFHHSLVSFLEKR